MKGDYFDVWLSGVLAEDLGNGDHSTLACIDEGAEGKAILLVKETGVIAGVKVSQRVFEKFDKELECKILIDDGSKVNPGDKSFEISGSSRSILTVERTILNIMQRMSGIATKTNRMVEMISHTSARLLDTRKTTPGMRAMEKSAVLLGGGFNHRHGLYDMIMLKDNHIDFCGGVSKAIQATRHYLDEKNLDLKIEIEVRNISELELVLIEGGVHRIMLDNFSLSELKRALDKIGGRFESEASGGITELTIVQVAETGVDYISVGALTHSVEGLDLSLKADI